MRIEFEASDEARAGIADVGRTEDLLFSPDGTRLAIVGFSNAKLLLLEVEALEPQGANYGLRFGRALTLNSNTLNQPHGVAWIDNETLIVANRKGQVPVFRVPRQLNAPEFTGYPISTLGVSKADFINGPGSVAIRHITDDLVEVMICNNFSDYVTRHVLDRAQGYAAIGSEISMREGLQIPDGVVYSASGRRVAVSSHVDHTVQVYDTAELGRVDKPIGTLRGVAFPHGLRFTPDDRGLVVADAGAPFVYVFGSEDGEWRGVRQPLGMIEVIAPDVFVRGHVNPEEGGPKGLALSPDGALMFVTCEEEPLAVFNIREHMQSLGLFPYREVPAEAPRMPVEQMFNASLTRARSQIEQALAASAEAKAQIVAADAKIAARDARIAGAEAKAVAAEARARAAEAKLAAAEARAKSVTAKLSDGTARLNRARGKVSELETKLAMAQRDTRKVLRSASWRITAPLRAIRSRFKGKR